MFVSRSMAKKVATVDCNTGLLEAHGLMQRLNIGDDYRPGYPQRPAL